MSERRTPVIPTHILIQLYTRFLLNLPNELKADCGRNFVRLLFEVERAHWFYLDHYIEDASVGGVDMFGFTEQLFQQFPHIVPKDVDWRNAYLNWRRYRGETETGSAIILDEYFEMVLLVQGFYGNRWNFPGGKINENESLMDCAARETLEETGLDVEYRIITSLYMDRYTNGVLRRAFIVENMPRISCLQPCTRNEIEAITWFNVRDLPTHLQDFRSMEKFNIRPNNFYLILPFVRQLQEYIRLRQTGLSALSALERSSRLIDPDHIPPCISNVPKPSREQHTSKPSPSRSKKSRKIRKSSQQPVSTNKVTGNSEKKCPATTAIPENKINLKDFRKNLILLDVPADDSTTRSDQAFSPSCWHNVRVRGDVLVNLLLSCSK